MSKQSRLFGLIAVLLIQSGAAAAGTPSDREIQQRILGSWIIAADSADYTPQTVFAVETFKADGTYALFQYSDITCTKLIGKTDARWVIKNGVLISTYQEGGGSLDQVLQIDNTTMTLHSLDDGSTNKRTRTDACEKPTS